MWECNSEMNEAANIVVSHHHSTPTLPINEVMTTVHHDRDDDDHLDHDFEKTGFLLKKTSKGLWVNRYFVTERNMLSYWHDINSFEQHDNPSEKYDVAEIKSIERTSHRGLIINFLNSSKFKLEVRALVDNERNEWAAILEGKSKLYSVDELLSDLRLHAISFKTKAFATLMFLHEKDQNKWLLDRLDEIFEISGDDSKSTKLRSNSSLLLRAACRALDEFLSACVDGEQEMASREPKIMAHTRYVLFLACICCFFCYCSNCCWRLFENVVDD
jgi:hypothetical protein